MIDTYIQGAGGPYIANIEGPVLQLSWETGYLIYLIYSQLLAQDPEIAEAYRRNIQKTVTDNSPLWELEEARSDDEGAQI